jgi:hypothetical protein
MTRWFIAAAALSMSLGTVAGGARVPPEQERQPASPDAIARLEAVRTAMGGADRLAAVETAVMIGRYQTPNRGTGSTRFFLFHREVRVLLPDGYYQADRPIPPNPSRLDGRQAVLGDTVTIWGGEDPATAGPEVIEDIRWNFGYLMLCMFMKTDTVFEFTLRGLDGDTLRFEDPLGLDAFVELDGDTNLPRRFRYQLSLLDRRTREPSGERSDIVVEVEDFKPVEGLRLPHRLTRYSPRGTYRSTWSLADGGISINPPLTPANFKNGATPPQ